MMTRRDLVNNGTMAVGATLVRSSLIGRAVRSQTSSTSGPVLNTSFKPGQVWLDTAGKPIQAHGGSILRVDDTFYWYGENKEDIIPGSHKQHDGIRCYSSTDLYNWLDLGVIIPAVSDDPASPLHPSKAAERPHILYSKSSRTFVCWIKGIFNNLQYRVVLSSDKITGPYKLLHPHLLPCGMGAGDFDLVISTAADQKAYMFFEHVHSELICADLTEDYTDVTGYYSTHLPHPHPPEVREGPAYFFRKGQHYLATSGTTGYYPNPTEVAIADTFHGPWTVKGDMHPTDPSRTSFNSQICSVFKHPRKKDLYIALADRWIPDLPQIEGERFANGEASRDTDSAFGKVFSGEPMTKIEGKSLRYVIGPGIINTSIARYVWLPIVFRDGCPTIEWRDEWSLSEFA
jgi:hypothetical protein